MSVTPIRENGWMTAVPLPLLPAGPPVHPALAAMHPAVAEWFRRRGRVTPLLVAHAILDTVNFVGYDLLKGVLRLP